MKKYEINSRGIEVPFKDRFKIKQDITFDYDSVGSENVASFATLEEAREALKEYKSTVYQYPHLFLVTEYVIEEYEYDEDGDGEYKDTWATSEMVFDVVDNNSFDKVATFDNLKDAYDYWDYSNELYIECNGDIIL